jgi:hypothetical protein
MNLALNNHCGELITDNVTNEFDLIVCVHLSVTNKIECRIPNISDEISMSLK